MAKIPRLDPAGVQSAGAPGGGLPNPADSAAGFNAVGRMTDVGYAVASDLEKTEALKAQKAMEAKQAIVNEVEAGRRTGDYEEDLSGYVDNLKKQFWDEPDKAPGQLLDVGRQLAARQVEQVPNAQIGLALAQRTNARLESAVREMHNWARDRQTQKAKGDLSIIVNRATAGAEGLASPEALGAYIKGKEAELTSTFQNVLGPGESEKAMTEMRSGMAKSWALARSDHEPLAVLQALQSNKGPLVDYLNVGERESLRKDAKSSFEGAEKQHEMDVIQKGISGNRQLFEAFQSGAPDLGSAIYAQRKAIDEQRKAVKAQLGADAGVLKSLGIEPSGQTKESILSLLDDRDKFAQALDQVHRRQTPFTAEDNPAEVEGLILANDKALKAKNGKDLTAIVKQQSAVAGALADKKISYGTAATLFKTMAVALDTAANNQEELGGPNTWQLWRGPQYAGSTELTRQFGGQYKALDKPVQNRVRLSYMSQFNTAQEKGTVVTDEMARRMALRALAFELGEPVPGAK